jgi:ribonucleoside-diphosphate reductase alpha chain
MCKVADAVVSGGVRRSACISLSNLSDERMRNAKSGAWWENNQQRALANNSICYTEKPDIGIFMKEWHALYESKSGERGIFNRVAAMKKAESNGRRSASYDYMVNPCGEIILRPYQFCNLTTAVIKPTDTLEDMERKVQMASILGTFQSTLIHFPYLRDIWRQNTEDERLLGVDLCGVMDHPELNSRQYELMETLDALKDCAVKTNKYMANKLGIPQATATTAIKPNGTVSQLVGASSGLHPRHSEYYLRRVRTAITDPLTKFLRDAGVPCEPDVTKPDNTLVFTFPQKAPEDALLKEDLTAIEHLELWLVYSKCYCEHNPSVTISVKENEWLAVGAFVYEHFDEMVGVSFLPYDGGSYAQMPFEECTKEQYEELLAQMPVDVDWDSMVEDDDNVEGVQNLACSSGFCEI